MIKIVSDLTQNDYDLLQHCGFKSKKEEHIISQYNFLLSIKDVYKSKKALFTINKKQYCGEVMSYSLVTDYKPLNHKAKEWLIDVYSCLKIKIKIPVKDIKSIEYLQSADLLIDNRRYYASYPLFVDCKTVEFIFIAYDSVKNGRYLTV